MNKRPSANRLFFLFLILWFGINLLQAILTEINTDEAYYFVWGKYPDWGYFDHPPLAGLLTHISSWLFQGNLGVRFMTTLLQVGTLVLLWFQLVKKDAENRSVISFFIIAASLVMFSAYGFITTPDAPLLFFTVLFLLGYKKLLDKKNRWAVVILAIAMAGLVYSKYHGVLIIGFTVLSNIRLLANGRFWLAGFLALVFCTPHFWWLYENGFPSFRYQFAAFELKISHFLEYLPTQLAAFNPLTLGAVIYILFRYKPSGLFERSQFFIVGSFLIFFWLLAYKGHVQAQWTVAASIPMIILLHNRVAADQKFFKYSRRFIAPTLLLILVARIVLIAGWLPVRFGLSGKEPQYRAIEKNANGKPVIFTRAYQQAALYWFFTGKPASIISSLVIRQSQFDLWKFENNWTHDSVFIVLQANRSNIYDPVKSEIATIAADHFQSPNNLWIDFEINSNIWKVGDSLIIGFNIQNNGDHPVNFKDSLYKIDILPVFRDKAGFVFRGEGKLQNEILVLKSKERSGSLIKFNIPDIPPGYYQLGLSCNSLFGPANSSNFIKIKIVK